MLVPEKAVKAAKYSNVRRAKVSAVAFASSGEIIATAHNRRIDGQSKKFTQHAEEALINKLHKLNAFDRFRGITILVIRINKKGLSMAKPCKNCHKLLSKYPVKIKYSGWDQQIHDC